MGEEEEVLIRGIFNPLALEIEIEIVAHHLCKMWIFYEPKKKKM